MKLRHRVTLRVTGTADPKFGLMSFPELVASVYFLWDIKDTSPTAASFYKKLLPVLKRETLKYVYEAITREIKSCFDHIVKGYEIDDQNADTAYAYKLDTVDVNLYDSVVDVFDIDHPKCRDLLVKIYQRYDGTHESIRKIFQNIKACLEFFNCVPYDSAFGGAGWRKITETALAIENAPPAKIMTLFDHIIHIQHYTGNVFNKFKFGPVLDKIIELKAKKDGSMYLGPFVPKGPIKFLWQRYFGKHTKFVEEKPFDSTAAVVILATYDWRTLAYLEKHNLVLNIAGCDSTSFTACLTKAVKLLISRMRPLNNYTTAVKLLPKCVVDAANRLSWSDLVPEIISVLMNRTLLQSSATSGTECSDSRSVNKVARQAINTLKKYIGKKAADTMWRLFQLKTKSDRLTFCIDKEYITHNIDSLD